MCEFVGVGKELFCDIWISRFHLFRSLNGERADSLTRPDGQIGLFGHFSEIDFFGLSEIDARIFSESVEDFVSAFVVCEADACVDVTDGESVIFVEIFDDFSEEAVVSGEEWASED